MGLGHINTTSFLFGDDEDSKESTTSPDVKSYLQMNATDDKFPILVQRNGYPGVVSSSLTLGYIAQTNGMLQLSASSAALDLALSPSPRPESQDNGWTQLACHRLSQQTTPQGSLNALSNGQMSNGVSSGESQKSPEVMSIRNPNRHSMEASLAAYSQASQPNQVSSAESSRPTTLGNIHASYSTNDVPTLKKANVLMTNVTPTKNDAEQKFHNHNASLGRIPANAMSNRHSRELSGGDNRREEQANAYQQILSSLQASAAPFGPATTAASPVESMPNPMAQFNPAMQFASQPFYPGYGMQMMNLGMNPMPMANPMAFQNQMQGFQPQNGFPQNGFTPYPSYGIQGRFQDNQGRVMQQRRMQNGDGKQIYCSYIRQYVLTTHVENARFTNVKLEDIRSEILGLCKDQHGCRYLQKKLEERNPEYVQMIFIETYLHVVDLMTGNASLFKQRRALTNNVRRVRQLSLPEATRIL